MCIYIYIFGLLFLGLCISFWKYPFSENIWFFYLDLFKVQYLTLLGFAPMKLADFRAMGNSLITWGIRKQIPGDFHQKASDLIYILVNFG